MPEKNLDYWVYSQYYRKNKMHTAGLVCFFCFAAVGARSKVNGHNHTTKSINFSTMHVVSGRKLWDLVIFFLYFWCDIHGI